MPRWRPFGRRLREASDWTKVVSQYTNLTATGRGLVGLCPLPGHSEKTPSFHIDERRGAFYCFGCGRGGDIFRFVSLVLGKNFYDSLRYLAQKSGLVVPQFLDQGVARSRNVSEKQEMADINQVACDYYRRQFLQLSDTAAPYLYLKNRGFLKKDLLERFQLGYAPDGVWTGLVEELRHQKRRLVLAQKLGLIRLKKTGGYYDVWRGRVMFPIVDTAERVVGFGGRVLESTGDKEDSSMPAPKYINSPDSLLFHKGEMFYGLNQALPFLRYRDTAILVEGYTDVLALHKAGVTHAIATLGTALTEKHVQVLRRYCKNVVVMFDGDQAGQKAAQKSLPLLLAGELFPKCVPLPEGKDPDEALKEGACDLENTPDLFHQVLEWRVRGETLTATTKNANF